MKYDFCVEKCWIFADNGIAISTSLKTLVKYTVFRNCNRISDRYDLCYFEDCIFIDCNELPPIDRMKNCVVVDGQKSYKVDKSIEPEWSVYNNTIPLHLLSEEQAFKLVDAWRSGFYMERAVYSGVTLNGEVMYDWKPCKSLLHDSTGVYRAQIVVKL